MESPLEQLLKDIEPIKTSAASQNAFASCETAEALEQMRVQLLGRKSALALGLRALGTVSDEERRKLGPELNGLRKILEEQFQTRTTELETAHESSLAQDEQIDITLPGITPERGTLHPVTQMSHEIAVVLENMGFTQLEGPHVETDWRNFEGLNFIPGHPARDMQATFFVPGGLLMRTHCTAVTMGRAIPELKPPFRVFAVGSTFRRDDDRTHTTMFHQFDAQVLAKDINLSQFKGTIRAAMRAILQRDDVEIRFRQSYFPFTEPSVEVDVTCTICNQDGSHCGVCKGTGWLEMGGAGMTHPNVLRNFGVDPNEWQGFAWGFGVERPFMIKHGVPDLRAFFENDLRWLRQF